MNSSEIFEPPPIGDDDETGGDLDELIEERIVAGTAAESETVEPEAGEKTRMLFRAVTIHGIDSLCAAVGKTAISDSDKIPLGDALANLWIHLFPNMEAPSGPYASVVYAAGGVALAVWAAPPIKRVEKKKEDAENNSETHSDHWPVGNGENVSPEEAPTGWGIN